MLVLMLFLLTVFSFSSSLMSSLSFLNNLLPYENNEDYFIVFLKMLSKKYADKGTHMVGKRELKKFKGLVSRIFGQEKESCMDDLFAQTRSISEKSLISGCGDKFSLFLFDGIPLFVDVKTFKVDEDDFSIKDQGESLFFPTLFFLLIYRKEFDILDHLEKNEIGSLMFCHGPISKFLISGANLMVPGIVDTIRAQSRLCFIFSTGMRIPYAMGVLSNNFLSDHTSGVGAFILHCYKDPLWCAFEEPYNLRCAALCCDPLPPEFSAKEVLEGITTAQSAENLDVTPTEGICFSFSEEDKAMFCFGETLKVVTPSMLPLKLSYFMSLFSPHFPRVDANAKPIEFKDTKYKKALTFLKSLGCMTIEEKENGVHTITDIRYRGKLIREHEERYKVFLEKVQIPKTVNEAEELELTAMVSDTAVYSQKIHSVVYLYKPEKTMDRDLAYILLLGKERDNASLFPSLEEGPCKSVLNEFEAELDKAFHSLYTKEELVANLNQYIRQKSLFDFSDSNPPDSCPFVRLEGPLKVLSITDTAAKITDVRERCLSRFSLTLYINVQTSIEGICGTGAIPIKQVVRVGKTPEVFVSEVRKRNHFVTRVTNLENLGFNLQFLCKRWRKHFSTWCAVAERIKGSNPLPREASQYEIHLGGKFVSEIKKILNSELGIPVSLIQCRIS